VGGFLISETARRFEDAMVPFAAVAGLAISGIGYALDHLPWQLYRNYDFWHTSPNFFLIRLGILLIILSFCEARTRLRPVFTRWRPLNLLGQHSLLVYWVHIEFVYGRLHVLPRQAVGIGGATLGLLGITSAMVLLALAKQQWDRKSREKARLRAQPAGASA
jgi:peptidoglycan/LPS O-acetylase OafA/YrhL